MGKHESSNPYELNQVHEQQLELMNADQVRLVLRPVACFCTWC
jgi:hypothetical protein